MINLRTPPDDPTLEADIRAALTSGYIELEVRRAPPAFHYQGRLAQIARCMAELETIDACVQDGLLKAIWLDVLHRLLYEWDAGDSADDLRCQRCNWFPCRCACGAKLEGESWDDWRTRMIRENICTYHSIRDCQCYYWVTTQLEFKAQPRGCA